MPQPGQTRSRIDPALTWAAEMAVLIADAAAAAEAGDLMLTKHRLALVSLAWRRRLAPASSPLRFRGKPKRSG